MKRTNNNNNFEPPKKLKKNTDATTVQNLISDIKAQYKIITTEKTANKIITAKRKPKKLLHHEMLEYKSELSGIINSLSEELLKSIGSFAPADLIADVIKLVSTEQLNILYIAAASYNDNSALACFIKKKKIKKHLKLGQGVISAIKYHNNGTLKYLIDCKVKLKGLNKGRKNALHFAIKYNNVPAAEMLLKTNINYNTGDAIGLTPLIMATRKKNYDILKLLLLKKDLDINKSDPRAPKALIQAMLNNDEFAFDLLLKHDNLKFEGFKYVKKAHDNKNYPTYKSAIAQYSSALHVAAVHPNPYYRLQLINHDKVNINLQDSNDNTALHSALEAGHYNFALKLINHKDLLDINLRGSNGNTALHLAIRNKAYNLIKTIVDNPKSNINLANLSAKMPLDMATDDNDLTAISLLNTRTDLILLDDDKIRDARSQVLFYAIKVKQLDTLIESNALNFDIKNDKNISLLEYAAKKHNYKAILQLIDKLGITASKLFSAIRQMYGPENQLCSYCDMRNCIETILENHSSIINEVIPDTYGKTLLHQASIYYWPMVTKLLVEHNPDSINQQSKSGDTALSLALEYSLNFRNCGLTIIKFLLKQPSININSVDNLGNTPLFMLASNAYSSTNPLHLEAIQLFLSNPDIDFNILNISRKNIANYCADVCSGNFYMLKILMSKQNIDFNMPDKLGYTAAERIIIHQAMYGIHPYMRLMLEKNAKNYMNGKISYAIFAFRLLCSDFNPVLKVNFVLLLRGISSYTKQLIKKIDSKHKKQISYLQKELKNQNIIIQNFLNNNNKDKTAYQSSCEIWASFFKEIVKDEANARKSDRRLCERFEVLPKLVELPQRKLNNQ